MTNDRYTLKRKIEKGKGNKQSGLELEIIDAYTGKERHVSTLSGGEGFKASLALALGLADVIQSYAGGVQIETMFVDEGFGTLDPEVYFCPAEGLEITNPIDGVYYKIYGFMTSGGGLRYIWIEEQ